MFFRKNLTFLAAVILFGSSSFALVNTNNGNFSISYSDFSLPSVGVPFEVTRTYNSRSNYVQGFFGVGWSSNLESYLKFSDRNIVLHEGGGGNALSFKSIGSNKWQSTTSGKQSLVKKNREGKVSYILKKANLQTVKFDAKGRMTLIADQAGNYLKFIYSSKRLSKIQNNKNKQMSISWGDFGNRPRITLLSSGDLKARFTYDKKGNLKKAIGADAIPYTYAYDDEHNMLRINYQNGSKKKMTYNKIRDWVSSFTDQENNVSEYRYESDALNPENKFGTTVVQYKKGSKNKSYSKFWYEFRKRSDGSRYNYRTLSNLNGNVSETIFTECCGTPLAISEWKIKGRKLASDSWKEKTPSGAKKITRFEYYPDGLLKQKISASGVMTKLTYDSKSRKIASVKKKGMQYSYKYDPKGNLKTAVDFGANKKLELVYDLDGRVKVMIDSKVKNNKNAKYLYFRYKGGPRPVQVKHKNASGKVVGVLNFKYNKQNRFLGMYNAKGQPVSTQNELKLAESVARAFKTLVDIVEPASVDLNPEA